DQMILLGRRTATERTASFLVTLRDRWKRINGQSAHVALPMTRADIADYLGLTVETVSRSFTRLRQENLIAARDPQHIELLDAKRLLALAEARA
ncbi:MAG: helix-turn-helix domain-containing protein, partial [Pseudoxanthomonas sp.]